MYTERTAQAGRGTYIMNIIKKRDLMLTAVLLFAAAASFLYLYLAGSGPSVEARVYVDGALVETLDLRKDQEITIDGANGGTNHLIVEHGEIWCSEASCPDKLCVRQGKKHLNTDTIICRPNRMSVAIIGEE